MHEIVPATPEHVDLLVPRLRQGDLDEIKAASGSDPGGLLMLSVALSPIAYTWLHDGQVMAIFGVAPYPGREGVGIPWLLGAEGVERHKTFFVRHSKHYQDQMLARFAVLENWVDCRNTASIQWLSWCGFALAEVNPFYGAQRLPFIRFVKARCPDV